MVDGGESRNVYVKTHGEFRLRIKNHNAISQGHV